MNQDENLKNCGNGQCPICQIKMLLYPSFRNFETCLNRFTYAEVLKLCCFINAAGQDLKAFVTQKYEKNKYWLCITTKNCCIDLQYVENKSICFCTSLIK